MQRNIFVIGLNDFHLEKLQRIKGAEGFRFHRLLMADAVLERDDYPIGELIEQAHRELDAFDGEPHAIVHYIDFPVSTIVPILCRQHGLTSASLESVLRCEHKYWSRCIQREAAPENVPRFEKFDPFDDDALSKLDLEYPFWIKPIKSFSSFLAFRINTPEQFHECVAEIREHIGRFEEPFNQVLKRIELPEHIRDVGGGDCLAEQAIGGHQVTLECYVYNGELTVYGVVDSLREPNGSSFNRYQYPSKLPKRVQRRMRRITRDVIAATGYDNAPFNIELFWDEPTDRIWLLEINPRISASHCDLFEKVDGASHHQVAAYVALGEKPPAMQNEGEFEVAAKCFYRRYKDALVRRVPTEGELAEISRRVPGAEIDILPEEGKMLSDLKDQDSYSYVLATIYVGGRHQREMLKNFRQVVRELPFELDESAVEEPATA